MVCMSFSTRNAANHCGKDICLIIENFLKYSHLLKEINRTNIALISIGVHWLCGWERSTWNTTQQWKLQFTRKMRESQENDIIVVNNIIISTTSSIKASNNKSSQPREQTGILVHCFNSEDHNENWGAWERSREWIMTISELTE